MPMTPEIMFDNLIARAKEGDNVCRKALEDFNARPRELRTMPESYDPETREVDVTLSTERAVEMFDFERWEFIPEVLSADGVRVRGEREQIPLLDTHDSRGIDNILGSVRNIRAEDGEVRGRLRFSESERGKYAEELVREGHLTDVSVGYMVSDRVHVPEGEKAVIDGREFEGPLNFGRAWEVHELSLVPIGADTGATMRSLGNSTPGNPVKSQEAKMPTEQTPEAQAPVENTVDLERTVAEAEKRAADAEFARAKEIRAMADGVDPELVNDAIDKRMSVDEARKAFLANIQQKNKVASPAPSVEVTRDQREQFRNAGADALAFRAGGLKKVEGAAEEYVGLDLAGYARESLILQGESPFKVNRMGKDELFSRAMSGNKNVHFVNGRASGFNHTTSDFPFLLATSANKSLQRGYAEQPTTYQQWVNIVPRNDFKTNDVVALSAAPDLELVNENGEIKQGSMSERREQYSVSTYGKGVSVTRQTLINDDMAAFGSLAFRMGQAARRHLEKHVYYTLRGTDNLGDTMSDSNKLFDDTNHSNYISSGTAISVANLSTAWAKLMRQTGLSGELINVMPAYLLVTPDIYANALQVINSQVDPSKSNAAINPFANSLQVISTPYFSDAFTFEGNTTSADTNHWVLAASTGQIDTIELGLLNGVDAPSLNTEEGFDILGMKMNIYIDSGCKAIDWRGLVRNAGA